MNPKETKELAGYPRVVQIKCPQCGYEQEATVHFYQGDPFPSFEHTCIECDHEIGESEWNEVDNEP